MPCAFGYSVLTSVEGVQNLVEYFHFTSCSYSQNFGTPFELKGVKCDRRVDVSHINSTDLTQSESSLGLVKQHGVDKSVEIRDYSQRKNESSEQKEKRLAKATEYKRQKRQDDLSSEQQERRLEKCRESMRTRRKNKTSEQRKNRLAKKRSYRKLVAGTKDATKNNDNLTSGSTCDITLDITQLIRKFHKSVSTGPLYVCHYTCHLP